MGRARRRRSTNLFCGEGPQHVNAGAGQERGVDFEGRILGGGSDQDDVAAFDVGKERILLGVLEAMDFVDEEELAAA